MARCRLARTLAVKFPPRVTVTAALGPTTVWVTRNGTVALPVDATRPRAVALAAATVLMHAPTGATAPICLGGLVDV